MNGLNNLKTIKKALSLDSAFFIGNFAELHTGFAKPIQVDHF